VITGNVRIEQTTFTDLELPMLEVIGGTLTIPGVFDRGEIQNVRLPALETTGGGVELQAPGLDAIAAFLTPRLESVPGATLFVKELDLACLRDGVVRIGLTTASSITLPNFAGSTLRVLSVPNATSLSVPRFSTGTLQASDSPMLASIEAPAFVAGTLTLTNNASLANVQIGADADIELLELFDLPGLSTLQFLDGVTLHGLRLVRAPLVTALAGNLTATISALQVSETGLASMEILGVTTITSQTFSIENNPQLTTLTIPALTSIERGAIIDNPLLPTCYATRIRDQVAPGTSFLISGNGSGSCP
jgi:hypothetical protein